MSEGLGDYGTLFVAFTWFKEIHSLKYRCIQGMFLHSLSQPHPVVLYSGTLQAILGIDIQEAKTL
jgi:hypothetical protein